MSVAAPLRSDRRLSIHGDRLPTAALVSLCLVAFALIVVLSTRLSYFNDDWYFLLQRPGLESHGGIDTVLAPHNGNMVVVLAVLYKVIVGVFGMHAVWPYRVITAAAWATLGAVVYLYVQPRQGPVVALLAAAIALFLGPAWEAMLFFNASNHEWAVTLGLASLILLERDTPRRNATVCLLLTLGVGASNTALALTAGAAVAVILRRKPRQLWIVVVPVAVFGLWWLRYGRGQDTGITVGHIAALPGYMFDAFSSGVATILGLKDNRLPNVLASGHLPAIAVLLALAIWLARGGRPRAQALWVAAGLIAFWLLAGASAIPGRGAPASRYQVTDGVLILVLAAELLHEIRLSPAALTGLAALTGAIVISNLITLHDGYVFLRIQSGYAAADTGALRLAGPLRADDTWLLSGVASDPYLSGITARRYFAQTAAHGTPAFDTPQQLAAAPQDQRAAADGVLIAAEQIRARIVPGAAARRGCSSHIDVTRRATVTIPTGTTLVQSGGSSPLALALSRFASPATVHGIAFLPGGAVESVRVPRDGATQPWRLTIIDPGGRPTPVAVCSA